MRTVAVVYHSDSGSTKILAEAIHEKYQVGGGPEGTK